ncbi:MAG: DUF2339 domain-containing protein, partial [Terracidiphilus sp.]
LGVASFLIYKLPSMTPAGKVLTGFLVSFAFLGGGVWLERRETYRLFARAGIGGGWALAFFTTFALYHVPAARVLDSLAADLVLMMLVAAGMVAHSLVYRSQAVTGLAFLLGFATLLTSHLEAAQGTVAFSLIASAVLALALVVVTTRRHWVWLELAGLAAVYLTHALWLSNVLPPNRGDFREFWPSTALIVLYWLIFRLAYVFRTPLSPREESLSSLTAVLNSTGVLALLKYQSVHPEWAAWALAAMGATEMLMAFRLRARRRQAFVVLSTIAVVLLVSAVPFRFHGVSWPVLWLVEAQILALAGLRLGEPLFRRLGLLAGLLTGGLLAIHDVLPILLLRFQAPDPAGHGSLIAALALAALLYWTHAEIYPRRWPAIAAGEQEAAALAVTSWLALAAAAAGLWLAVPDRWLPIAWLALVLVLGLVACWTGASRLAIEADLLAAAAGALLIFGELAPVAHFRLDFADPSRHQALTAICLLAALAYWLHAELFPRALGASRIAAQPAQPFGIDPAAWSSLWLPAHSTMAAAMAASALWLALDSRWVVPAWLALVLLLGLAADWLKARVFALQGDLLAVLAFACIFAWMSPERPEWQERLAFATTAALFYAAMRRRTPAFGDRNYGPAAYSWVAAFLCLLISSGFFPLEWSIPVEAGMCLVLFDIGRFFGKGFLRWQGLALAACAVFFYLAGEGDHAIGGIFGNPLAPSPFALVSSMLLSALVLSALGYWLMERTRDAARCSAREHIAGLAADALGTLGIVLWLGVRLPVYVPGGEFWLAAIWAALATLLVALAWLLRRRAFLVQAVTLAALVLLRGVFFDLPLSSPAGFWRGALFRVALAALILFAALPFAYRLRREGFFPPSRTALGGVLALLLRRPEQVFFFAPFLLMAVALAVRLTSGHITIAWSLLGLGVFLFALVVGERSFRLAGLGLLLISVAKILLIDVWSLPPADRFPVLIVLGLALLAVSFLYTRFRHLIRKLL